jgi:hypothetical protein
LTPMSDASSPTLDEMAAALRASHGLLTPAADALGITPRRLLGWLQTTQSLRHVQEDALQRVRDEAAQVRMEAMRAGESWAVTAILRGQDAAERARLVAAAEQAPRDEVARPARSWRVVVGQKSGGE